MIKIMKLYNEQPGKKSITHFYPISTMMKIMKVNNEQPRKPKIHPPPQSPFNNAGNTLEGDVSDVIALDQLTSPISPRKATRMSP